ncbi:MAG: S4 domain-containing protein [Sphingorhabdus sp.]
MTANNIRIDKLLFFLRLAKSRSLAVTWADAGHIRINGHRVERASATVKAEDIITLPRGENVLVIKLVALPTRRGPALEARTFYALLDTP